MTPEVTPEVVPDDATEADLIMGGTKRGVSKRRYGKMLGGAGTSEGLLK